jgi:beta-lactam-binding protein with PASTA domain
MAHVNSPIPNPVASGADISSQLSDVIVKLLQKSPLDRYQSAGEALAALRRCGRGEELDEASGADSSTALMRRRSLVPQDVSPLELPEVEPAWNMRRTIAIAAGALVIVVVIALLFAAREASSRALTLPDLSGKSQVEAVATLHDAGIDAVTFRQRDDPNVAAGLVDGSDPAPNAHVNPQDPVVVYLSAGPGQVAVPNVVGKDVRTASAMLSAAGLTARVGESVHSSVKQGLVARTNPAPNGLIAKGGTIALNPSSGPQQVKVPNLVSLAVEDAQAQLGKLGLRLTTNIVPSVDIPARTVIDQDPAGGSEVQPGSVVTVDISAGPNAVTVPNVVGSNVDDARGKLEQAGLALGSVAHAAVADTSPGTVVGQHPDANSQAPQGTAVDVVVATAPAPPQPAASGSAQPVASPVALGPIPNVIGMSLEDARAALAKAGYTVSHVTVTPGSPPNAHVVRTDPPAGTTAPGLTFVDLTLGSR